MPDIDWKARFSATYANLPSSVRDQIVVVLDNEPYTWKSARIEVENNTKKGNKIIEKLVRMAILK